MEASPGDQPFRIQQKNIINGLSLSLSAASARRRIVRLCSKWVIRADGEGTYKHVDFFEIEYYLRTIR